MTLGTPTNSDIEMIPNDFTTCRDSVGAMVCRSSTVTDNVQCWIFQMANKPCIRDTSADKLGKAKLQNYLEQTIYYIKHHPADVSIKSSIRY